MPTDFTTLCALALAAVPHPAIEDAPRTSEASIASDGRIAFIGVNGDEADVFVAEPDGGGARRLTTGGGKDTPSWSPDGTMLAFVWDRNGNADIHILDVATGEIRAAITGPAYEIHPGWSPDGRRLIFTRYTEGMPEADALTLHTADLDGSGESALGTASYGSWSADGAGLAYWRRFDGNADIAVADADRTGERRLTDDPEFEGWPSWSPDGRLLAYARRDGENTHIRLLDTATGESCPATQGDGRDTSPRWRADGNGLYFDRSESGRLSIMALAFDVSAHRRVQSPDSVN